MPLQRLEGPSLGNVTANTLTTTASVNAATFYAGANVSLNTTAIFIGNSSVNTVITSSSITGSITGIVSSSTGFATTLVAGETLAARDAVYVEPALTSGTAGRVYKMDADVLVKSTQAFFAGFALASASAAGNVNVQLSGVVSGFSGLTTGAVYYAGSTAGAITATKPLHPLPVGMAISTTQLLINTGIKREQEQAENVTAVYGYVLGGQTGAAVATADRTTFSTGATAAYTAANLSQARAYMYSGCSDIVAYGYIMGGWTGASVSATDRITFATGVTTASTISNISTARNQMPSISDGSQYGYVAGGVLSPAGTPSYATTDRLTFSSSVTAAFTAANLSVARYGNAGVSDGSVYGYFLGGYSGAYVTTADRLTFSTSATAAYTGANLSLARYEISGVSDGAVYGYALGGNSGATLATADRITFSTGVTAASTVSNLSTVRLRAAGFSDGTIYGYVAGGSSGAYVTTADRITFSTSVTAAFTTANLSQAREAAASLSDGAV